MMKGEVTEAALKWILQDVREQVLQQVFDGHHDKWLKWLRQKGSDEQVAADFAAVLDMKRKTLMPATEIRLVFMAGTKRFFQRTMKNLLAHPAVRGGCRWPYRQVEPGFVLPLRPQHSG